MKTNMKKLAAWMLALLLVLQILPAMAEETYYTSGVLKNTSVYRDKLEIQGPKTIKVGESATITVVTEGYNELTWSSGNEEVATVENGEVFGVSAGTVKITAKEGTESDSIIIKVIGVPANENENENDGDTEAEPETAEAMVIIISGNKDKLTYDGQEHEYSGYTVDCSDSRFDESKLHLVNDEKTISAKDCGTYTIKYEATDFAYDDSDVTVIYDLNDGWMQIKPANVTVKADDVFQKEGEEAELTATVTGLAEGDDPSVIQYSLERLIAGDVIYITPVCEPLQGNYRVTAQAGILTIEGGIPKAIKLSSDWPEGQPAYKGTKITMTAELIGFDNVDYTSQWQYSLDQQEWTNVPGATGTSLTFEVDETTVQYIWRVVANY